MSAVLSDPATCLRVQLALFNARPGEVAQRAGISPATLSRILRGHQRPSPDMIERIETALREVSA